MEVHEKSLEQLLNTASFETLGDPYERKYGHYFQNSFPNCERFWRLFVIPLTRRMNGYPRQLTAETGFRPSIDPVLEDISSLHYSMFLNLVFAHLHLEAKIEPSLEDIYVHLGSACDLVEAVLEKWYLLLLQCRGEESHILQQLSKKDFLGIAENWYDNNYQELYEYYLSKGKNPPVDLIEGTDVVKEYLGKKSAPRKAYRNLSMPIRQFRNRVVHDAKIARIINPEGKMLIPKPGFILNYKSWRQVAAVASESAIIKRDFVEAYEQAQTSLASLEGSINDLWERLITDYVSEFQSRDRDTLRKKFGIVFVADNILITSPDSSPATYLGPTSPSGYYPTAGSANFPQGNDFDNSGSAVYRQKS